MSVLLVGALSLYSGKAIKSYGLYLTEIDRVNCDLQKKKIIACIFFCPKSRNWYQDQTLYT